jgi:predicted peptidase
LKANLQCGIFLAALLMLAGHDSAADSAFHDQLLRLAYESSVTGSRREYFVYLPADYEQYPDKRWPVMLFLHGNGERGDGLADLDYVLRHGPLMEAWIQRRKLPFIIISPQLPLFGELEAIADRASETRPERLAQGVPERNYGFPSDVPIQRTNADGLPAGWYSTHDPYPKLDKLPAGWDRVDEEVIGMVDTVLEKFRADPVRVYLTGISMGGFGSFHLAAKYPERWAAVATVVATGRLEDAPKLAESRLPIWMFGGGKDLVVKPHWLYEMAGAMEQAGHPALRFTVHEDMDHDAWKRVYEGEDLFSWLLRYRSDERPGQPEKSK